MLLLREVDKQHCLTQRLASVLNDARNPELVRQKLETVTRQRVFGVAAGHEDLNDHEALRFDQALQTAISEDDTLADKFTLCRMEQRVGRVVSCLSIGYCSESADESAENEDASHEGKSCPIDGGEHTGTNGLGTDSWDISGSYDDAVDAASGLTGGNLKDKGNGVKVGTDADGNNVIVRPGGGGKFRGDPANGTIEIQPSGGGLPTDKIRYR